MWTCFFIYVCVHFCVCACTHSVIVQLFATPLAVACCAPLSMEFSRQEYWSELLFPSPEDLPNPGIKPVSPALAGEFFTTSATWEALISLGRCVISMIMLST